MSVYPNPTQGELTITGVSTTLNDRNRTLSVVEVYDMSGRLVFTSQVSLETTLNISHLKAGTYFVRIGNQTAKIVKN